jgi:hypothetical protein
MTLPALNAQKRQVKAPHMTRQPKPPPPIAPRTGSTPSLLDVQTEQLVAKLVLGEEDSARVQQPLLIEVLKGIVDSNQGLSVWVIYLPRVFTILVYLNVADIPYERVQEVFESTNQNEAHTIGILRLMREKAPAAPVQDKALTVSDLQAMIQQVCLGVIDTYSPLHTLSYSRTGAASERGE